MSARPPLSINDNHRRGISTTLWLLDEMLCRFDRWTHDTICDGVLVSEHNDCSEGQALSIMAEVASMRVVLAELKEDLALRCRETNTSKLIAVQCFWFWESLVELQSGHLNRYGTLPADFPAYFDPKLQVLTDGLQKIGDLARDVAL